MERIHSAFLKIMHSAMQGETLRSFEGLTAEDWKELFTLAEIHRVLPLVYQTVYAVPELGDTAAVRSRVRRLVMLQTMKTAEFLELYEKFRAEGIVPVVVKGMLCRRLYPQPDLRLSDDEDILIPPEQFEKAHRILTDFGMYTKDDFDLSGELDYYRTNSTLYVELHRSLFPSDSEAYGAWNRFFDGLYEQTVMIDGVRSLCHTDHLMYLLCHAFKHFLHSGFGVRQVCDIVLYANAYGREIDWERLYRNCCEIKGEVFTAALFQIGAKHLGFDPEKACYPALWQKIETDETAMLEDLLAGGIYGSATMDRRHSSGITLSAVTADRQGKKAKASLKSTLFPSAKSLEGRFPYLKKHPCLLPAAWVVRIAKYGREMLAGKSAAESVKIGSRRVELLREYKVIR